MFYLLDLLVLKSFLKKSYERYTRNLGYYGGPTMVLTSSTLMSLGISIPVFSRTSGANSDADVSIPWRPQQLAFCQPFGLLKQHHTSIFEDE